MDERTKAAINRIRAGEVARGLSDLHGIVKDEPNNINAWYAISYFTNDKSEKLSALQKVLELDPNNQRAVADMAAISPPPKIESHASYTQSSATSAMPTLNQLVGSTPATGQSHRDGSAKRPSKGLLGLAVVVLAMAVIALFIAVIVEGYVIAKLWREQVTLAQEQTSMASELERTTYLAENANQYAHSHGYSDQTLKQEIVPMSDVLAGVLSLSGVSFAWTEESGLDQSGRHIGVLAQDVAAVFPELVAVEQTTGRLMVDYDGLTAVLIEAIREQQTQIDELRTLQASD